jgi:hypothetical protein
MYDHLNLILEDADLTFLAAFEISAFSGRHDGAFRVARSDRHWLEKLKSELIKLPPNDYLNWPRTVLTISNYQRVNERIGASTLAAQQARGQLPLRTPATFPEWTESGNLYYWRLESISIGVEGAACIRHRARLKEYASVDEIISGYHTLVQEIYNSLTPIAQALLEGLSQAQGPLESIDFAIPTTLSSGTFIASYECIDIEYAAANEEGERIALPAKRLVDESLSCTRQFAALSRMTKTEPDHFDPARLEAFKEADIANREDEIWVINSNRMIRSNPDRHDLRIRYFYEDVICFVELALQHLAVVEHVNSWLHDARAQFRKQLNSYQRDRDEDIGHILLDFERVLDLVEQPGNLLLGIRHPFFRSIADRLITELQLPLASAQTRDVIAMFTQVASAAFTFRVFITSEATEVTVRRLTWLIMIGTLIGTILAVIALVVSQI